MCHGSRLLFLRLIQAIDTPSQVATIEAEGAGASASSINTTLAIRPDGIADAVTAAAAQCAMDAIFEGYRGRGVLDAILAAGKQSNLHFIRVLPALRP